MNLINRGLLDELIRQHADAEQAMAAWVREVKLARWQSPAELKARYATASFLEGGRVVFNIHGNRYRVITRINYAAGAVEVRFAGTHQEYGRINAEKI